MEYEEVDDMSGEQGSYGDGMLNESGEGTNIASPTYSDEEQNDRTGSDLGSPRSPQSPHSPASPSGPASPNEFGDDDSHGPRSPNDEVNGPASPSPESPSGFASPGASPHGSPMSPDGSHRSRSVSPSGDAENRSRSGSPAAVRSRSGSPAGSRSRSRSYSASPRQSQSRSRSGSPVGSRNASPRGSRSGSPIGSPNNFSGRSRSGSRQGSQSRSVSPAGSRSRSRSGSPPRSRSVSPARSRSGSPARSRSRSGSPARSRSGSPARSRSGSRARSGSGSVRSRSGSPARSRSGSVRSRSGSPARSRSRSISPARSRSRSRSHSAARSRSGSAHGSPSRDDDEVTGRRKRRDDSDNEGSDKGSEVGELIADIFGSSDEEEFEGFGNAEAEAPSKKEKKKTDEKGDSASVLPDLSDEDDDVGGKRPGDFVSDFDLMLEKKKEEMRSKRKRRKDVDIINDNDDLIDALINRMKQAAEEDRELNQQRKPAVKKLGMLPKVVSQLKKADLQNAFIDGGILNAMTEWLAPLPDKSLPHLQIREAFLRQLLDFPTISNEGLKTSGIGKAVMYLYKHPKELRTNKEMAQKLINEWSRPIFNLTSDLKQLSREEREQRDYEHLPKKRRISLESGATPRRDIDKALTGDDKVLRPGDPGYIYRARVPQPSVKDYVIRPKWNIEEKAKGSSKKQANKYELHMRAQKRKQSSMKQQRAVTMSIEGRNMAL